ncbi:MAG: malonyl-CoA decarboxylase family protein [Halioglobus sp.]|nr:malonyl-CoA decarboxylase family protein [Halioglobus sp.]
MPEEQTDTGFAPETTAHAAAQSPGATITTLGRTIGSVLDAGRVLLTRRRARADPAVLASADGLIRLCVELLEHRGEASGLALASAISDGYQHLPASQRGRFFLCLAREFDVDRDAVLEAAESYREEDSLEHLQAIVEAVEAPRQKLFRRINMAPAGTRTLVAMRGHLLEELTCNEALRCVEADLKSLFFSWFNKGFLQLRRIDWSSPAHILEKIIQYEAVHEINGWDDLRSRLRDDRRCFAFFHPALDDEPLVFVEIALTATIPNALEPLLAQDREVSPSNDANTVVFYSISNCHPGLVGISFGYFLIKAVIDALRQEMPQLGAYATLSPVPGFRRWLQDTDLRDLLSKEMVDRVREPVNRVVDADVYDALVRLCAHYLVHVKSGRFPRDGVARFHLGNGALLHGLHGGADLSKKGLEQSAGIMVNYVYDLAQIEENHEAYMDEGKIALSKGISRLLD